MAELAKASTWERTTVVEKSGFAVMPGTKSNDSDIARACVELLLATGDAEDLSNRDRAMTWAGRHCPGPNAFPRQRRRSPCPWSFPSRVWPPPCSW